jgi:hypothetical protein
MTQLSTSTDAGDLSEWTRPRGGKMAGLSALDHLFNRLDGMYPGKWKTYFPNEQSIQNWKEECDRVFAEEGIALAHLAAGLRACRRLYREWPPSVPQLAEACNPPVDPIAAYHEALTGLEARARGEVGEWSHPAIYWAASGLRGDLASQPGQFIKDRWAAALRAQLARGTWEAIPPARVLLPAPGKSETSSEAAAFHLAKLGAMGILKTADTDIDCKRWAKQMLAKQSSGEKTHGHYELRMAREVLGEGIKTEGDDA